MEICRPPKRVITYGTYDLFHEGHKRLLERARELGDYLIVGIASDMLDYSMGKLNVRQSLPERFENIERSGLADKIIVEEYENQAIRDVQKYKVDVFTMGSDWTGRFDYLRKYCEVVYLDRTPDVSSTRLRGQLRIGIIGWGSAVSKFIQEARHVAALTIKAIHKDPGIAVEELGIDTRAVTVVQSLELLYHHVDAVYIATSPDHQRSYVHDALEHQRHVLCHASLGLSKAETKYLYAMAAKDGLVLFEGIQASFLPAFDQLVGAAHNGAIGQVIAINFRNTVQHERESLNDAKKHTCNDRERYSHPLLVLAKILGTEATAVSCRSIKDQGTNVEIWSQLDISYKRAHGSCTVILGKPTEGDLVITGSLGNIHVPGPWWEMKSFSYRYEDEVKNHEVHAPYIGDPLRYMMVEFIRKVNGGRHMSTGVTPSESYFISGVLQQVKEQRQIL